MKPTTPALLIVHEIGHIAANLMHAEAGSIVTLERIASDEFEVSGPTPSSAEQALDGMFGGVLAEILHTHDLNIEKARKTIERKGWRDAVPSAHGMGDMGLLQMCMTDAMALDSFDRIAGGIADFLQEPGVVESFGQRMQGMGVGQRFDLRRRQAVN